jgi:hypothetical protein
VTHDLRTAAVVEHAEQVVAAAAGGRAKAAPSASCCFAYCGINVMLQTEVQITMAQVTQKNGL